MAITVRHAYVSPVTDAGEAGIVGPDEWNDEHDLSGTLEAAQYPALTGDVTTPGGSLVTTLATVNANVGTFGSATKASVVTVSAKGTVTAASESTITPAASSVTGGAALTRTNDTNVTLTLGGAPTTALLAATSITAGWTGTLANARLADMAQATFKMRAAGAGTGAPIDGTTLQAKTALGISVSVKDYGAAGDGIADDTAEIQAAIDSLGAGAGGGVVYVPKGTYIISATINLTGAVTLQGDGWASTFLQVAAASNIKALYITGARNALRNLAIYGTGVQGNVLSTVAPGTVSSTSHCVHTETSAVGTVIDNCYILGGYHCLLNDGVDTIMTNCTTGYALGTSMVRNRAVALWMKRTANDQGWPVSLPSTGASFAAWAATTAYSVGDVRSSGGFYIQCRVAGTSGGTAPTLTTYFNDIVDGAGALRWRLVGRTNYSSLLIDTGASETHCEQSDFTSSAATGNIVIQNNDAGTAPFMTFITNCILSQSVGTCMGAYAGNCLALTDNEIGGGLATGSGGIALQTASWIGDASIVGNHIFGDAGIGIYVGNGNGLLISANSIGGFSTAILFEANINKFSIIGNTLGQTALGGTNGAGITINAGTSNYYTIAGNIFNGCTGTALTDGGTGTNKYVEREGIVALPNATGLPISTGVSGLGTGVATFLATPSSANLRSALTDENGTGAAVFTSAITSSRFHVTKGGTDQTTFADAAITQITFGTEVYDVGSFFASDAWTPPAGPISMSAGMIFTGTIAAGADVSVYFYKNGSVLKQAVGVAATGAGGGQISADDVASGTDVYTFRAYIDVSAGTSTILGAATQTWWMGSTFT